MPVTELQGKVKYDKILVLTILIDVFDSNLIFLN